MSANPNQNSHTNLFNLGMDQDSNIIMQPDGSYRYAKNFQLISHNGNNFTIQDTLGNRKIFQIPRIYNTSSPVTLQEEPMPNGFISFTNRLVVFSTNEIGSGGGYGEIGFLYITNYGQTAESDPQTINVGPIIGSYTFDGYVPLYGHADLKFSRMYKIEGFGVEENDATATVYWTDYNSQPRALNVLDPLLTTYYDNGSLVSGQEYMVLGGIAKHAGTDYGPGLSTGNVFTATGANYTVVAGQPLIIKYYNVQLLNFTPSRSLGNIYFKEFGTGVKNCGNHQYFYRLINDQTGYKTSWSYGSFPVHVGLNQYTPTAPTFNTNHNYVGDGNTTTTKSSGKSIKLNITNIDTKYDQIELACAEYLNDYELPAKMSIVQTRPIDATTLNSDGSIDMEDYGNVDLGTLTLDDITLFPANVLKCKSLTTNKNYIIAGNITERSEFEDIDFGTPTYSDFVYHMPVDLQIDYETAPNVPAFPMTYQCVFTPNVNPTNIFPKVKYVVTSVAGGSVTYNAQTYGLGDVFEGVSGVGAVTIPGASQVRPCFAWNKYTPQNVVAQRKNVIEAKTPSGVSGDVELNYRNPAAAMHLKSYRSGEKYRFGICFFDKRGNPFYVRHLNDYTFTDVLTKGGLLEDVGPGAVYNNVYSLTPNGFKISGLQIPKDVVDEISGFSIVRAECDKTIITQGLLWQVQHTTEQGVPRIQPLPTYTLKYQAFSEASPSPYLSYSYICPDYLVDFRGFYKPLTTGNKLKIVNWLTPLGFAGSSYKFAWYHTQEDQAWSKLYAQVIAQVVVGNEANISGIYGMNEGEEIVNFVPGWNFYNARMGISTAVGSENVNNQFAPGSASTWGQAMFVGGRKLAVTINNGPSGTGDFWAYGNAAGGFAFSDTTAINDTLDYKALANFVVENSNQYGGTGEDALAQTLYISTGHFQPITSQVISDNYVGASVNNYSHLLFDDIEVFGGDTFVNLIDYGYGLYNTNYLGSGYKPAGWGLFFPCENNVNYDLRNGRKVSDFGMHEDNYGVTYAGNGAAVTGPKDLGFESYAYNDAYSSDGVQFAYPALPVGGANVGRFPYRMRFAGKKFPGEQYDSFRNFLVNDYIDVDGSLGEINNVRAKGDRVFYWQNHGTGSSPILERAIISGTQGSVTSLGTGGVIDRYDTIDTKFGNQHQHGLTEYENGWIWFDMRNKDLCIMSFGGALKPITMEIKMKSFFNEVFLERNSALFTGTYLNSPTYDISSDRPLLGTGIVGVYDPKNKMVYLTFKFKQHDEKTAAAFAGTYTDYQVVNKDFTIGYHALMNKAVGFFDKMPAIWHNHNQFVLSANNPKNLNFYYASNMLPTPATIGDVIGIGNKEYVCVFNGTATYSATPVATQFYPINKTNEIYIENEMGYVNINPAYLYNIFYGRVVSNEIQFVINPNTDWPFSVTNLLSIGNEANFTDFEYTDGTNTASDNDVNDWNRNYKLTDKGWFSNLPISKKGELTGQYIKARFVKKNYIVLPITNDTIVKILQKVKSYFDLKF